MVESSSTGVNKAQLVGTQMERLSCQSTNGLVLEQFFKRNQISRTITTLDFQTEPGIVYFKESSSSQEQSMMLLKNRGILPPAAQLPAKLNPAGLSQERQQYLYRRYDSFVSLV